MYGIPRSTIFQSTMDWAFFEVGLHDEETKTKVALWYLSFNEYIDAF